MASNPAFLSYLTQQQGPTGPNGGGVNTTTKKNPYAQTAVTAPTPGNSPVTPTGALNPAQPPPQPRPSSNQSPNQLAQQQQPPTPDPFAAMGGGNYNWATGGWTPKNMGTPAGSNPTGGGTGSIPNMPTGTSQAVPGYMQHLAGVQPYQGTQFSQYQNMTYDPTQLSVNMPQQYGQYNPYQVQTQLPTQGYQAGNFGTTPFTQYQGNPNNISQFQGPQTQAIQGQEQALLSQMLANPYSMNAQNVAQLKEKQKETALALQQSGQAGNAEAMAARGMYGGGQQGAIDAQLRDQANKNILTGYRDIDLQKMTQDRQDLLDALGAADTSLNSASNRATSEYSQLLAGQQAREKVGLDAATSAQAAERLGLDRTTAQELANYNQAKSAQDLASLGLERDALGQKENQFAFSTEQQRYKDALQALGLEMDAAAFNAGENYKGYQSAAQNQQDAFTRELAGATDRQAAADSALKLGGMLQSGWDSQQARDLQAALGNRGLDIDQQKIGSNEKIAGMDNQTRLLDILLSNQLGRAQLGQQGKQFDATFGLENKKFGETQKTNDNLLMQWLFQNGGF